jgi:hypothetical protein
MVTVIRPDAIKAGDIQQVKADLTKFDIAKQVVDEAIEALKPHLQIKDETQMQEALELAKDANKVSKAIEDKRKELGGPFADAKKEIDNYAKSMTTGLDNQVTAVKNAILVFQKAEEKRKLQEKAALRQKYLINELGFQYNGTVDRYELAGVGSMSSNEITNYDDASFNHVCNGFLESIRRNNEQKAAEALANKDLVDAFGDAEDVAEIATATQAVSIAPPPPSPVFNTTTVKAKGTTLRWTFELTDTTQIPREYLVVDEAAIRKAVNAGVRTIPGVKIFQTESLALR